MLEIEEYVPFHIGIKLIQGMPLNNIKKSMKEKLESNGYEIPIERKDMQFPFNLPLEPIGFKNNVEVTVNFEKEALNIVGETPNDVKDIFKEILDYLLELNYDNLEDIILFYEIVTNVGLKSDNNPLEVMDSSLNIKLDNLKKINPQISPIAIRIGSFRVNLEKNDHVELIIEPKKGSHSDRYMARLRYQSKNKDNILTFPFEDELIQIISSLEEG